jgi:tRNA-dihydrouridine synthase B
MPYNFWQKLNHPILALAPMVDVSDSAFRQICKKWGADVVYSEMISADAVIHNSAKTLAMMDHHSSEQPLVVQLMGKVPKVMAEAAKVAEAKGAAGIDINFGCPAKKITKNACGAVLMRNLDQCRNLIQATIKAVDVPVSIKTRTSINYGGQKITVLDLLDKISDLSVAAIMVHGRSFEALFDKPYKAEVIAQVKEKFIDRPVLANGGVTSIASAKNVLEQTKADGLGLARSVIGAPWVFRQIGQYLRLGHYDLIAWPVIKKVIISHVELFDKFRGPVRFQAIRRHLTHYIAGRVGASAMRKRLVQVNSVQDVKDILASSE